MKRFPIVAADLFTTNVGTLEQREVLRQEIMSHHNNNSAPLSFSNDGCWRSMFRYKDESWDWLLKELKTLQDQALRYYMEADPTFSRKAQAYGNAAIQHWTNVNEPGSKNVLHVHNSYHFVGLYYVQGTGTGDLVFLNPSNITENCNPYSPFVSRMAWTPNDGDLILWPGWMPHETEINKSTRQRINIAFNIRFNTPTFDYA